MIRTLQKKFVITAMTAISVLLLLLLGAINGANIIIVGREIDRTLAMISKNEGDPRNIPEKENPMLTDRPLTGPKNERDTFLSSTFFLVGFDTDGRIVHVDVDRIASVSEDEARELAEEIYQGQSWTGRTGRFRYEMRESPAGDGRTIVFLDISTEIVSYVRVLLLSAGIGLCCWGLMLLFVMGLSKRAIRPIAENMERQKQFVTNAGHEIKTPLAIILANTDALELYNGESKWSRNIREQIGRLDGLMKQLLLLARMEEGGGGLSAADFSLSELLAGSVQTFLEPLELRHISLQSDIQPDVMFHADKEQIAQLISILLDNSVKYTEDGGEVLVRLQKKDRSLTLRVENTCESLPDTSPDRLFDRFSRGDAARTQKSGGYGIGLSAAQSIVRANRGSISAEYEMPRRVIFQVVFHV